MNELNELPNELLRCASWLSVLLYLAAGVVAFVRLKTTPSGLLIGGGLVAWSMASMLLKVVRYAVSDPTSFDMTAFMLLNTSSSCIAMFFCLIVAVGFAMLPRSLAKLEGMPMKVAPREG